MKLLHTVRLRPAEWLALLLLSATPLLVHELLAFLFGNGIDIAKMQFTDRHFEATGKIRYWACVREQ